MSREQARKAIVNVYIPNRIVQTLVILALGAPIIEFARVFSWPPWVIVVGCLVVVLIASYFGGDIVMFAMYLRHMHRDPSWSPPMTWNF